MSQAQRAKTSGRISRRGFLLQTGTAAGAAVALPALIPASALGADGKAAPSARIGVGIIGLGRQCCARNISVFVRSPDCQMVALCDVDRWRLESSDNPALLTAARRNQWKPEILNDCFRSTDFREVLARKGVDAVMISTPDFWHVPIALAAVKAGKDVCCEKPIGMAIHHGRVLADAVARSKCVFRTDSEFRSVPNLFKAVRLVRTGKIGQLQRIRISVPIYWDSLPMPPAMATAPARSANWATSLAC